jgi:hypothetical protein
MGSFKYDGTRRAALETDDAFQQWMQSQIALCAQLERQAVRSYARRA